MPARKEETIITGEGQQVNTLFVYTAQYADIFERPAVPDMNVRQMWSEFPCGDIVPIEVRNCHRYHFVGVQSIESLLYQLNIQQYDSVAHKINDFLIVYLKLLLVGTPLTNRRSILLAHSILKCPLNILTPNPINPLQLDFYLISALQIVVYRHLLLSVGRNRSQSRIQPRPEIKRSLVQNQESRRFLNKVQSGHTQLRTFERIGGCICFLLMLCQHETSWQVWRFHAKPLEVCKNWRLLVRPRHQLIIINARAFLKILQNQIENFMILNLTASIELGS